MCLNILVYLNNGLVNDLSTLRAGDQIQFAIVASPGITRARIKVNGQGMNGETDGWTTLGTRTGNEFRSQLYTLPANTTNFNVQGQIETSPGNWL